MKPSLLIALIIAALVVGIAYYEREFIEYRMNGCRCFNPVGPQSAFVITDKNTSYLATNMRCKGHPSYPRLCPLWLGNWLNSTSFALPPPTPSDCPS